MEKRTPHTKLDQVKALITAGKFTVTMSATDGAAKLGFDKEGIKAMVLSLTSADFYKSMTTYANHKVWQDVYNVKAASRVVYLKITVLDGVTVVSFKEKGD